MKYFILLFPLIFFAYPDNVAEFEKNCPYDPKYSGHYLQVPITIEPHQLTYQVGDTLRISTVFSDSIYDLSTEQTFKIQDFPFKPFSLLYRFYDSLEWDAGYSVNELYIPEEYEAVFRNSTNYADHFRAYTIYENEQYRFNMEVVLKEPGRYVMIFTDIYQEHLGGGASELNEEADAITFAGKMPYFWLLHL